MLSQSVKITHSVLFVCTGNQIRSPLAAEIFKFRLRHLGIETNYWDVESAGIRGGGGRLATDGARKVIREWGLSLDKHHSKRLSDEMIERYALILVMEPEHKEILMIEYRPWAKKIFLLSEMIGEICLVEDPLKGDSLDYQRTVQEIDHFINLGLKKIIELARVNP